MPWANGQGSTTEIFKQLFPTTDRFLWRVSLADVPDSGRFSVFDGYERVIAVA
ncbi:MAG: HutD family protein, partial [Alphaproteobacteria bacterium]|nr:HutD family protein [Alphaproteobacteria bacterium]